MDHDTGYKLLFSHPERYATCCLAMCRVSGCKTPTFLEAIFGTQKTLLNVGFAPRAEAASTKNGSDSNILTVTEVRWVIQPLDQLLHTTELKPRHSPPRTLFGRGPSSGQNIWVEILSIVKPEV